MKLIDRYIFKTVAGTALVALLVLLILETFFSFLGEIDDIGEGNYGLTDILLYLLLNMPQRIYEIFPMALLLGGLLGMGSLASSSELVCMRAAGLSLLRLIVAGLQVGLVLGLLALIVGEFVAPATTRLAKEWQATAKSQQVSIRQGLGFWARDGELLIHVEAVSPGVGLENIHIYQIDEQSRMRSIARARSARYVDDQWLLEDVQRSLIEADKVTADYQPVLTLNSLISPDLLRVLVLDPKNLSMRDLVTYIDYLDRNGLDSRSYRLAFWNKVFGPLINLAMIFVAMPFAFGSQRTVSIGQRLLIGVFFGLLFFLLNRMLGNVVLLYGYPPLLGAAAPSLLIFICGAYALHRVR